MTPVAELGSKAEGEIVKLRSRLEALDERVWNGIEYRGFACSLENSAELVTSSDSLRGDDGIAQGQACYKAL